MSWTCETYDERQTRYRKRLLPRMLRRPIWQPSSAPLPIVTSMFLDGLISPKGYVAKAGYEGRSMTRWVLTGLGRVQARAVRR